MKVTIKAFGTEACIFDGPFGELSLRAETIDEARFLGLANVAVNGPAVGSWGALIYAMTHRVATPDEQGVITGLIERAAPDYHKFMHGEKSK